MREERGRRRVGPKAAEVAVWNSANVGSINVFDSQTVIAFKTALENFNDCHIQKWNRIFPCRTIGVVFVITLRRRESLSCIVRET